MNLIKPLKKSWILYSFIFLLCAFLSGCSGCSTKAPKISEIQQEVMRDLLRKSEVLNSKDANLVKSYTIEVMPGMKEVMEGQTRSEVYVVADMMAQEMGSLSEELLSRPQVKWNFNDDESAVEIVIPGSIDVSGRERKIYLEKRVSGKWY